MADTSVSYTAYCFCFFFLKCEAGLVEIVKNAAFGRNRAW